MGLKEKAEGIRERGILADAVRRHVRAHGSVKMGEISKRFKADEKEVRKAIKRLEEDGHVKVVKSVLGKRVAATDRLLTECPFGKSREDLLDIAEKEGKITLVDAAERLETTSSRVGEWAELLRNDNLVAVTKEGFIAPLGPNILRYRLTQRVREKSKSRRVIYSQVDYLYDALRKVKGMTLSEAAAISNTEPKRIEEWARRMDIFRLEYPSNITKEPVIHLGKVRAPSRKEPKVEGKVLDSYKITADKVVANVSVIETKKDSMPIYIVNLPEVGVGTESMMDSLRDTLSGKVKIDISDLSDTKKMIELNETFFYAAKQLLLEELKLDEDDANMLSGMMTHAMYGLGDIELLMHDDWLEEVCVNTSHVPLTAYHKRFGWVETNLSLNTERTVYNYAAQIGRKVERDITNMEPIMDAHLISGDRVNATLFPISSFGNTITIRKFARQPWTLAHFISPEINSLSVDMAAFLWLCFQYELNVIVGGGTASGKTSMLNCLCSLIQPTHRVITIEDTRELNLPTYLKWNWIPLTTRGANPEGKGEVSMLDLIVTSLRMRPDRIVLGEIRRRREAEVLFEAMHTGHSVYGTIHADTVQNLKRRLIEPPIELPSAEVEALHLMIVVYRDRKRGTRKVFEIAEIRPGAEGKEFSLNYLFRYNARTNEFVTVNESVRIMEELGLHTGMSGSEIKEDLKDKKLVLQWMLEKNKKSLDEVGEVMDLYYKDADGLLERIRREKK